MHGSMESFVDADRRAAQKGPWQEERHAETMRLLAAAGVVPSTSQERTLRWLAEGELHSLANVVDLILAARRHAAHPEVVIPFAEADVIASALHERRCEIEIERDHARVTASQYGALARARTRRADAVDKLTGRRA